MLKFAHISKTTFVSTRESGYSANCCVLCAQQLAQQVDSCWDMSGFVVSPWYSRSFCSQEDFKADG